MGQLSLRKVGRATFGGQLIAVLLLSGCNRMDVHPSVYDPQGVRDVQTWYVGFTYFGGAETETATAAGEVAQTTVQREAPRHDDLQLRDDLEFRLRDRFGPRIIPSAARDLPPLTKAHLAPTARSLASLGMTRYAAAP